MMWPLPPPPDGAVIDPPPSVLLPKLKLLAAASVPAPAFRIISLMPLQAAVEFAPNEIVAVLASVLLNMSISEPEEPVHAAALVIVVVAPA